MPRARRGHGRFSGDTRPENQRRQRGPRPGYLQIRQKRNASQSPFKLKQSKVMTAPFQISVFYRGYRASKCEAFKLRTQSRFQMC